MSEYWVDDGGDNSTGADWATAYTSINALDAAVALASGDIVNFGHDHNCQAVNAASLTITGPTSGLPVIFRSVTQGSDPPTYQKGTGTQIDTTEGSTFDIIFDGAFSLRGIRAIAGRSINFNNDTNESLNTDDCTLGPAPTGGIDTTLIAGSVKIHKKLTVDLSQDVSNTGNTVFSGTGAAHVIINGLSFINPIFRTGDVFGTGGGGEFRSISGADFSGFTNATVCEIVNGGCEQTQFANCKTAVTHTLISSAAPAPGTVVQFANVGPTDDPTALTYHTYFGKIASSTSIYRSGGATIEGIANSWLVTTTANCNEYAPFHSPWLYSKVKTAGDKIVSLFIVNDTADFTDAEAWIEVEFLDTDDSPLYALGSDQRATITTTPVAQEDDTDSTWTGVGPAFTYKQKLSVPITVGEVGRIRARLVTGVESIASSRRFYLDPDSDHMISDA